MSRCLHFLRQYQWIESRASSRAVYAAHLRSYSISRLNSVPETRSPCASSRDPEVQERIRDLRLPTSQLYPRIKPHPKESTCRAFLENNNDLVAGQSRNDEQVIIRGRVGSVRIAGSRLFFVDLLQDGYRVQGLCNFSRLSGAVVTLEMFRDHYHKLRRGDILSLRGTPHKTKRGELSVLLSELPQLLSPCLHHLPTELQDQEIRVRKRHVDYIVNPQTAEILRLRAEIINYMRTFLVREDHVEVQTPILANESGGAVARPFRTSATEFPERRITLRIAPELWLKRLVVGGFDRVFEIGPSFRNEGLDPSHNPEFTTCEFYRAFADLEKLIDLTEKMFSGIAKHLDETVKRKSINLQLPTINYSRPFARLDFIPAIEAATGSQLPELALPEAQERVVQILQDCSIPLPQERTLPQLLDRLSSVLLEPQCIKPTFIINYPECLSPLSKSFVHPSRNQRVSARAELFVNGQEIVNTYEEENSPFEQRKKFVKQTKQHGDGDAGSAIDESYLEALEWGLPPTGGWGCGIDRLCMLMLGVSRIGDVLSFGTLRNVVALSQGR